MSQNEQGVLYPFRLSGSRMRQSATQLRRQGQVLDALTLLRRAAWQDDTPAAWQALAGELCRTGNYESAAPLLTRVLSRDWHCPGAWAALAGCMRALGENELAVDCACHQLQQDPWCPEADKAREILSELDAPLDRKEPKRTQLLVKRAMSAWMQDDLALLKRRLLRAERITNEPVQLLITAGTLFAVRDDLDSALRYLCRALRHDPTDVRALTATATLMAQRGRRRISRGLLRKAGQCAESVRDQDSFLTCAWGQDAWPELAEFLEVRVRRQPHRVPLLTAQAMLADARGDDAAARRLRQEILAIDPDDHTATQLLSMPIGDGQRVMNLPGMLAASRTREELEELKQAAEALPMAELLRPGSRTRRIIDWVLREDHGANSEYVRGLIERSGDPAVIPCLKELACHPFMAPPVRQWALMGLAHRGCGEDLLMMTGPSFAIVACQKRELPVEKQPWRTFLPMLLTETRRYGLSRYVAEFAAAIWSALPEKPRLDAAYNDRYVWVKAMEVLYLRMAGEDGRAARAVTEAAASPRKISRALRQIYRCFSDITD